MISFKEYVMMKKILKDPVSVELNTLAMQPDFMYEFRITRHLDNLGKFIKEGNKLDKDEIVLEQFEWKGQKYNVDKFSKKELTNLDLISRLITRNLVIIKEKNLTFREESEGRKIRYFSLTDIGYTSLLEYQSKYKFWIPIILSIVSVILSIVL